MSKVLMISPGKCVGCRTCEDACSLKQAEVTNPSLSRIQVVKLQMGIESIPIACAQCESAPCMEICPVKAISRDGLLGRVIVDHDTCIGCRMCVAICPFGCMNFDSVDKRVFKCELCDGDPTCVKFCQHGALEYVEASEQSVIKRKETAEKFSGLMYKITSAMATVEQSL
jgi:carbon-monoxide dehydrogenase iron sulfur subunit